MDTTDAMQRQAKALADPSRFQMFAHIANSESHVGVGELTELLGFNHNAIRQHLSVLTEAGLIAESTEKRTTRGRPRKQYKLRADALSAFGSISGSYERLASLLIEVAQSNEDPYEVGFRSAALGPADVSLGKESAVDLLVYRLTSEGFEPSRSSNGAITLKNCPFANVASEGPAIVCELHRGLIDGSLSEQRPKLVGDLVLSDPQDGGCEVHVHEKDTTKLPQNGTE